ncbi:hypothetical protein AURDEDRAFT_162151 [Auricularia subglabra TFB-10046 SS5]|nr:hypothetical protein AURDEDRAFT_162151 [Auricularia subglabra TFB-10046 SS5]
MRVSALIVAAVALAMPAQAFIAWSGDHCDGDQGNSVPCDGSCHSFAGRHSFIAGFRNRCVSLYRESNCQGQRFNFSQAGAEGLQCTNVNTGTNILSFRCWAFSNGCQ